MRTTEQIFKSHPQKWHLSNSKEVYSGMGNYMGTERVLLDGKGGEIDLGRIDTIEFIIHLRNSKRK